MLSGKFVLRLDPKIHQALKDEAKERGESLNSVCCRRLQSQNISEWTVVTSLTVQEFAPEGVVLFGSTARGEATKKSDVDLLVVMPERQPIHRDLYQRWDRLFRGKGGEKYSPQFVHSPNLNEQIGSIWLETALDGEIIYDSNKKLKELLLRIRSQIAEGRYLRKVTNGHSYWIRQSRDAK